MTRNSFFLLTLLAACGDSSSGGSNDPKGANCFCDVTLNGETETIACGKSACVNGTRFECSNEGTSEAGACTDPPDGSGGDGAGGGGSEECGPTTYAPGYCEGCSQRCHFTAPDGSTADWCSFPCKSDADCASHPYATKCMKTEACDISFQGFGSGLCVQPSLLE